MSLFDRVNDDLKTAMRARERGRVDALRNIRAAFLNEMKKDNSDSLDDATCVAILRRLEKQRKESIEAFEKGGRDEQAAAEKAELEILQAYVPSLADEDTTRGWVQEAVDASGAAGPGDVGRVMGALMKAHKGEIDGALAKKLAAELLAGGIARSIRRGGALANWATRDPTRPASPRGRSLRRPAFAR